MFAWKRAGSLAVITVLMGAAGSSMATDATRKNTSSTVVNPDGDNSKVNKKDDPAVSPTADQQNNSKGDLETTRKIRSALTDNESLSTYAQNVKIIAQNGEVVLKGPVRSADEKRVVESTAIKVAGAAHVKSELEVTPK